MAAIDQEAMAATFALFKSKKPVAITAARMRRDSVWKMSAYADPNPAPILASEN